MISPKHRTRVVPAAALALALGIGPAQASSPPAAPATASARDTRLAIRVFDAQTHALLPALVRLRGADRKTLTFGNVADLPGWGQGASAVEVGDPRGSVLAFRHGFALWRGEGTIFVGRPWQHRDLPGQGVGSSQVVPGRYVVEVTHGPEYDQSSSVVDLSPGRGQVKLDVGLRRAVDTRGYVSADFHVHHAPQSPDAQIDAASQLKIAAANGVDIVVAANHAHVVDLAPVAAQLWPGKRPAVSVIAGLEHEAAEAHFGVFPLPPATPLAAVRPWPVDALFADLHALPGDPLVIAFHPRLGWKAYLDAPYCGAWAQKDVSAPPPCPQAYDAMEVVTAWHGCGSRQRETTESWLALLSHNLVSAPLGSSDSHFASAMLAGYPRTWVRVNQDAPTRVSTGRLIQAVRARHTIASTAPFVTLQTAGGNEGDFITHGRADFVVKVRVQAANWVPLDTLRLLVNGEVVKSWDVGDDDGEAVDFRADAKLQLHGKDAFITAETDSRRPLPASIVGEYSAIAEFGLSRCAPRTGEDPGMPAFAVTAPLLVDGDGDGRFTGFRAHAPLALPKQR